MATDVGEQPLVRPPRLRTGQEATASRLELFFDLAYVLVIMELAETFLGDLTWNGFATFAALFVAIWLSWVGFTLYANRFDTDDVVFRVAKLAATLSIAGCAASAAAADGDLSAPFAASFLAGHLVLLFLYARAWRHIPDARPTIDVYLLTTAVSSALWAVSLIVDGPTRYWLWAAAVAVDAAAPIVATWRDDFLPLHMEHLPERFGLLVILVLGEAVGGAARGVYYAGWAPTAIAVGVVGFVVAATLWWTYFDTTAASSAAKLQERDDQDPTPQGAAADERHDLFVYGHLPLALGTAMVGVGIEDLVIHPDAVLPTPGSWTLVVGLLLFLAGSALILGGARRSLRAVWPWPTVAIPILAAAAAVPQSSELLLVGGLAAVCLVLAVQGTISRRAGT
ncbi:low temperature requirement protein A [Pseudonocardia pini]|uniref:low temperature requirement protein A n=1 Tax=Pseudonocardia pini TaxID=2758030 RepID=UPI0015F0D747|nr:low temperature requirement protein A [Pseudonocardia pini]